MLIKEVFPLMLSLSIRTLTIASKDKDEEVLIVAKGLWEVPSIIQYVLLGFGRSKLKGNWIL